MLLFIFAPRMQIYQRISALHVNRWSAITYLTNKWTWAGEGNSFSDFPYLQIILQIGALSGNWKTAAAERGASTSPSAVDSRVGSMWCFLLYCVLCFPGLLCTLPAATHQPLHEYSDGDVIIGGLFPIHLQPNHTFPSSRHVSCNEWVQPNSIN